MISSIKKTSQCAIGNVPSGQPDRWTNGQMDRHLTTA